MEETDAKATAAAVSDYIAGKGKLLLLATGERLTFARSADVRIDMNGLIKRVGRGGGRPDMASGAGIPECVNVARKILKTEIG
jgi:alanyl-tRNA synthetase